LAPSELAQDAMDYPWRLFARTVGHAITNGLTWRREDPPAKFALRQVNHIAAQAKLDAADEKVAVKHLKPIEKEVIRFYKKRCGFTVAAPDKMVAVFCVLYTDTGDLNEEPATGDSAHTRAPTEPETSGGDPDPGPCIATVSATPEEAFIDFHQRFRQHCFPSKLDASAEEKLVQVFDRTVRYAIENNLTVWQLGDACAEFALDRVAEIATFAKLDASGEVISGWMVEAAAHRVVEYWRPKCGLRAVFCVDY
jgi:hypothetical protein